MEEKKGAIRRRIVSDGDHRVLQMQAACFRVGKGAGVWPEEERWRMSFLCDALRD